MNSVLFILLFFFFTKASVSAQEIRMAQSASLESVYGETIEAQGLMPMNELGMERGYVLYEAQVTLSVKPVQLEVENVRDYAAVYLGFPE